MATHRNEPPHFLHDAFFGLLKHLFDRGLVRRFNLIDLLADGFAIRASQRNRIILLVQVELHISILKEVVVYSDGARH